MCLATRLRFTLSLLLAAPGVLRADEPPASPDEPRPSTWQPPPVERAATPPPKLDFGFFDEPKANPVEEQARIERARAVEASAQTRRRMLLWHQGLGFATLAALGATVVLGQLYYDDKYGGGGDTGTYTVPHLTMSIGTTALFAATGSLALFAPNPYPKPLHFDSAMVHKIAMALATAGMVAQVVLGPIAQAREGKVDQRDIALAHAVTGWATFGFMAVGVVSYVF